MVPLDGRAQAGSDETEGGNWTGWIRKVFGQIRCESEIGAY